MPAQPSDRQLELLLPELCFPGSDTITADEVAGKLGVTRQHVVNCCDDPSNTLTALNIGRKQRGAYRIPVTSYYAWLAQCLTSIPAENPILNLETAKLIPLFKQLAARLELRGEHPINLLNPIKK